MLQPQLPQDCPIVYSLSKKAFNLLVYLQAIFFCSSSLVFLSCWLHAWPLCAPVGHKSKVHRAHVYTTLWGPYLLGLGATVGSLIHVSHWGKQIIILLPSDSPRLDGLASVSWPHGKTFNCPAVLLHARQMLKEIIEICAWGLTHTPQIRFLHQSSSPLYIAVGADKQCELTCRPAGYRFYVRLAERVRDGTPCVNITSNDVCVEGKCLVSAFKPAGVWF